MNQAFETLKTIITNRRTIKPQSMNGGIIPNEHINQMIQLADWAPSHGLTEPWRFFIFGNEKAQQFCKDHANIYQANAESNFSTETYNKLEHMGDKASHIIIATMRRGHLPKIPVLEEIAATSAAIQNLLLAAEALGIAAYWGTGGMILKDAMKTYLKIGADDIVLGALYLGYSEERPTGKRNFPIDSKSIWM